MLESNNDNEFGPHVLRGEPHVRPGTQLGNNLFEVLFKLNNLLAHLLEVTLNQNNMLAHLLEVALKLNLLAHLLEHVK